MLNVFSISCATNANAIKILLHFKINIIEKFDYGFFAHIEKQRMTNLTCNFSLEESSLFTNLHA